ncbi:hypothetical protein ABTY59_33620 [Streptomyces sp. NPDC096079]|uniref:hypothetical protein n=1 Tax=Streptomyces sp. NPDC096079 TaxID=3155820 RepID=UPI0033164F9B
MTPCPRCSGPLGDTPARSRMTTERTISICAVCGTDEAVREFSGLSPVPPTDWPEDWKKQAS